MISIVVSTHNPEHYRIMQKSASETIGVEFEIIPIENYGTYSIAEAYNMGAKMAKYKYICFVHEDVIFETNNWGLILANMMDDDSKLGLIGAVGAKRLSRYSLGWCNPFLLETLCGHLNQGFNSWDNYVYEDYSPNKSGIDYVVALDGFFLFTKKEFWEENNFDVKVVKGFHGYDLDFSLQIASKGLKAAVNKNVLLCHYSPGNNDKNWLYANCRVLRKWKRIFPLKTEDLKINDRTLYKTDLLLLFRYIKQKIKFIFK